MYTCEPGDDVTQHFQYFIKGLFIMEKSCMPWEFKGAQRINCKTHDAWKFHRAAGLETLKLKGGGGEQERFRQVPFLCLFGIDVPCLHPGLSWRVGFLVCSCPHLLCVCVTGHVCFFSAVGVCLLRYVFLMSSAHVLLNSGGWQQGICWAIFCCEG